MQGARWVRREHDLARRLFEEYDRINLVAARRKADLFRRLHESLESHALIVWRVLEAAEEQSGAGSLGEAAEKVLDTLRRLGELLDETSLMVPGEKQFDSKIRLLREYLEGQVRAEEIELFARAEKRLGRKRIRELGARIIEIRRRTFLPGGAA